MNELTLFDQIAEDPALEEDLYYEHIQEEKLTLEAFVDKYEINTTPDDLMVIRLLSYDNQFNNWAEIAKEYIGKQMTGLTLEDDFFADKNNFQKQLVDKISSIFIPIAKTLNDCFQIAGEEMHIGLNEDNIEYLAYLYNINAPFHKAKTIPYQELEKALSEPINIWY